MVELARYRRENGLAPFPLPRETTPLLLPTGTQHRFLTRDESTLTGTNTMLLFLDFDGVLHPQYDGEPTPVSELFCHLPRFESILQDFPSVEIVISSTWRNQFTLEELRSRFSPDI